MLNLFNPQSAIRNPKLALLDRRAGLALIGLFGFAVTLLAGFDGCGELALLTTDQILAAVGQIGDRLFSARGQIGRAFDAGLVILAGAFADFAPGVPGFIQPLTRRVGDVRTKLTAGFWGEEQRGDRAYACADQEVNQFIRAAATLIFCHDYTLQLR